MNNSKEIRSHIHNEYILWSIIIFLAILPLWANLQLLINICLNAVDYSIYQQALVKMGAWDSWNPFISVRGYKIFNDHFDPILLFVAPFFMLFKSFPGLVLIIEWAFYVAPLIYLFCNRKEYSLYYPIFYLCCGFIMGSLLYPGHPTTWAITPLFFLPWALDFKEKYLIIFCIFLCLFKEIFPFVVVSLSFWFFLIKEKRKALSLFILGISWLIFVFVLREPLLGPVFKYGGGIFLDPWKFIMKAVLSFNYKKFFLWFSPIFLFLVFYLKKHETKLQNRIVGVGFALIPLWGIHFLEGKIGHHYSHLWFGVFVGWITKEKLIDEIRKPAFILIMTFATTNIDNFIKVIKPIFNISKVKQCEVNQLKKREFQIVKNELKSVNGKILANLNVIPYLVAENKQVYRLKSWVGLQNSYDYLLIEKIPSRSPYEFSLSKYNQILRDCEKYKDQEIFKGKYFSFFKGKIPKECLND